jgi:hypothetical protein
MEPVIKVSDKLKEMLNEALAVELAVTIQYMWQGSKEKLSAMSSKRSGWLK